VRAPDGYQLKTCLATSARREVHLALRESDGRSVVLKHSTPSIDVRDRSQLRREFEILHSLTPGAGPVALDLEVFDDQAFLVLEALAGQALIGPVTTECFLRMGIGAAAALSQVHAAHVVHQNIRPEHLLCRPDGSDLRLIGFGRAAPLGAPDRQMSQGYALDGRLPYLSPEQTGRIGRGIDFRSDLYMLGATLYTLACGRPPFDARDPLDLIQAHIARRATPPLEWRTCVPATVSRIVMKLLEKEPEDRYQTAQALRVDLETCLEHLERCGSIEDELPLGSADAPYRPLFRQRIYGRDAEIRTLHDAYRRSVGGTPTFVSVAGPPGIGKSALVPELHRPLALDGGYLIRGKFDLYRGHLPYAGFLQALQSLAEQIRAESEERRAAWIEALRDSLGPLAAVASELVPALDLGCDDLEPTPELDPDQIKNRLALAICRLILGAARHASPLILFLDDLQWADVGSRYLLEQLFAHAEAAPLLVIGAYRDNDLSEEHPLRSTLGRIRAGSDEVYPLELGPLPATAAGQMLAEALGHPPECTRELATLAARHTENNPLLLQQWVYHLHELEAIRFELGSGWVWDVEQILAAAIPEDPVGMLLAKLQRLPLDARSILQFASCVGDEFDIQMLAELSRKDPRSLELALYSLSDEGLLGPCRAGFRFVHDRIREAAQALLSERERAQLHLRTASLLIEAEPAEGATDRTFEIADHLYRAHAEVPEERRLASVQVHKQAAERALRGGAAGTGSHYAGAALDLLCEEDWTTQRALCFDVHLLTATCAFQLQDFEHALELLTRIEQACSNPELTRAEFERLSVERLRTYVVARSADETVSMLLSVLEQIGVHYPQNPSWLRLRLAIARVDWALRGDPSEWTFREAAAGNRDLALQIQLRVASAQAMMFANSRLYALILAENLRAQLRGGLLPGLGSSLATLTGYRSALLRKHDRDALYALASRGFAERVGDPLLKLRTDYVLCTSLDAWTKPRRHAISALPEISARAAEFGDLPVALGARMVRGNYMGLAGVALDEVVGYFASLPARRHVAPIEAIAELERPYRVLYEGADVRAHFEQLRSALEAHSANAQSVATHWMLALSVEGSYAEVWWCAELVRPILFERLAYLSHVGDHVFFKGLAAAILARTGGRAGRRRLALAAWRAERYLRRWSETGPDWMHMRDLVRAERAWTRGRHRRALDLFSAAAEQAQEVGYVHHAALALEHRAQLLSSTGGETEAQSQRSQAADLYARWGAAAKAESLRLGAASSH